MSDRAKRVILFQRRIGVVAEGHDQQGGHVVPEVPVAQAWEMLINITAAPWPQPHSCNLPARGLVQELLPDNGSGRWGGDGGGGQSGMEIAEHVEPALSLGGRWSGSS